MKVASKSPSDLIRNSYSYCFQRIVPKDLQKVIGKKELRYPLKTGDLGVAKDKARLLAGQVQYILQKLFVSSKEFGQDRWGRAHHPHFFYIPLIALYTGCRLEKICQLYVEDVQKIGHVWCLDINENRPLTSSTSVDTHA